MGCTCSCGGDCTVNLLYACSGAANTGLLADQVARTLASDGKGSMTCLAAVGADLSGFLASARSADKNVVIDGCKVACGAKIFTEKGLPFEHYITTDFGVLKGQTPITAEVIETVALQIGRMM
ncbi:MAG: hypothetical protein A2Y31_10775 [Spirochaetes bacterium GWC2_52_13]|nr:MAG: hypothetical protein A2Y31_10775 [Spirochaetes bacterium GWC2_52_13]HCG63709.1 hypothetical protein [Sphaerochaeta sp.]